MLGSWRRTSITKTTLALPSRPDAHHVTLPETSLPSPPLRLRISKLEEAPGARRPPGAFHLQLDHFDLFHNPASVVAQERGHGAKHGATEPPTFRKVPRSDAWVVPRGRKLMQTSFGAAMSAPCSRNWFLTKPRHSIKVVMQADRI